jgi:DNA-binding CsgD family transcriptional regulator
MKPNFSELTEREQQICRMVKDDLSTEQIAERLGISQQGVRHHLSDIYAKVGVKKRLGLVEALDRWAD